MKQLLGVVLVCNGMTAGEASAVAQQTSSTLGKP
jgi:hypothetical protein